jgi:hypothetical protein
MSIDSISGSSSDFMDFLVLFQDTPTSRAEDCRDVVPHTEITWMPLEKSPRRRPSQAPSCDLGERHRVASYMRNGMCWIASVLSSRTSVRG